MTDFRAVEPVGEARREAPDAASRAFLVHWQRTRRLTAALLCLWLCATFGIGFFARSLEHIHLFGWPLSYYMGAQGSLIIFLGIIGAYALVMRRIDAAAARLMDDNRGAPR